MANVVTGTITQVFDEYRASVINVTGIVFNPAGGSNYTFTSPCRSRGMVNGSFVVSGTWATSTSVTVQLCGGNDTTNFVPIGVGLTASSGTTPQGATVSPDDFIFALYQWQITGGDSGTLLTIKCRLYPAD